MSFPRGYLNITGEFVYTISYKDFLTGYMDVYKRLFVYTCVYVILQTNVYTAI
jgi:hypothetical protein